MAKYSELIKGLQIFLEAHGDKHIGGAEHDIIYGAPDDIVLTDAQREDLEKAGWHLDEEGGWSHFA